MLTVFRAYLRKIKGTIIFSKKFASNWLLNHKAKKYPGCYNTETIIENGRHGHSCLCSIQMDISKGAIPKTLGYLFHAYPASGKSLYFKHSTKDEALLVATVDFDVLKYNFSVSPSGIIIATPISHRGAMFVNKEGVTYQLFEKQLMQPCGWLYNSGVDFIIDESGNECCVFAEYAHESDLGFFVWKGTAPYTNENCWKTVFHQQSETDIHHFHQIKRDPWTDVLYLTSGDEDAQNKWWYSKDYGESFHLLNSSELCQWHPNTLRTINFIFTRDFVYWATDSGSCHSLNQIERDSTSGLLDISTRKKLTRLPYGQGTNMLCYLPDKEMLFLYERIAWSHDFNKLHKKGFYVYVWSIKNRRLYRLIRLRTENGQWGGHRGKCYQSYGTEENCVMMGFSSDTPCIITSFGSNYKNIGTVKYNL